MRHDRISIAVEVETGSRRFEVEQAPPKLKYDWLIENPKKTTEKQQTIPRKMMNETNSCTDAWMIAESLACNTETCILSEINKISILAMFQNQRRFTKLIKLDVVEPVYRDLLCRSWRWASKQQ